MPEIAPTTCPQGGSPIKYVSAGISRKTGKNYSEFWSCSNRCGFTWRKGKSQNGARKENPKDIIIIEKLDAINERLNKMAEFLKNKLGE